MRYKLFQALQMNADRREEAKRLVGPDGDDCARAATAVAHYCPWVRRERNRLAQGSGFPLPYPGNGFELRSDSGESFYVEYAIDACRAANGGLDVTPRQILEAGECPCQACGGAVTAAVTVAQLAPAPLIATLTRCLRVTTLAAVTWTSVTPPRVPEAAAAAAAACCPRRCLW
jgi:hypothetical protein